MFFGGGSFLAESLKASNEVFEELKKHKVFYIGVGSETILDPRHQELISLSKLVAVRTEKNLNNITELNSNVMVIPDLVYCLESPSQPIRLEKSILIIPNALVVPKWNDPHWKHAAWDFFKIEFVQALDLLYKEKYKIDFMPFCVNNHFNDSFAAAEIISRCNVICEKIIYSKPDSFNSAIELISQYKAVITQRFHGKILAEIAKVPALTIYHHDKLKNVNGDVIPYYGTSKDKLLQSIKNLIINNHNVLPIDSNIFKDLTRRVEYALCRN